MSEVGAIPILEIFGNLVLPLQGEVGDAQCDAATARVLERARAEQHSGLVIDVSAVWLLDSHLCSVLARLAKSARLMGVEVVMCGMSPPVIMTLQMMGVELRGIRHARNLGDALGLLGVEMRRRDTWDDDDLVLEAAADDVAGAGQRSITTRVASS